ncbi:MAG: hypothetical protein ABSH05_17710 [Bryobacteraceae bacterium]|jgi:hypothetical protein
MARAVEVPAGPIAGDQAGQVAVMVEVPVFTIRADQSGAVPALMAALPKLSITAREAERILRSFELFLDHKNA